MKKIIGFILIGLTVFAFKSSSELPVKGFLDSLSEQQKEKAVLSFGDETREVWHFFPSELWKRPGLTLKELSPIQRELLFALLRTNLSETGFDKMNRIIDLENVLIEMKSNVHMRDDERYNITFYGNPLEDKKWAWSFEGHHISLNFTILDDEVSIAPRFFGASPAIIPSGKRKGERTLADEEDLGIELIQNMSVEQREKAMIQQEAFPDIVTSNASKVDPLAPVGVKFKELDKSLQKKLLLLIDTYLANMPKALAKKRMKQLKKEELDEIHFAWAGATELGKGHYYRVQGASFLIELDNTQNNANHLHSIWRDFDGDFGRDLIKEHYQKSHY